MHIAALRIAWLCGAIVRQSICSKGAYGRVREDRVEEIAPVHVACTSLSRE